MKLEEIIPLLNGIFHTVPLEEQTVLYEEAKKIKKGVIVDIGTCEGGSAFIMALASPTSEVWTIDPNPGPNFLNKRKELGLEDRVHFMHMGSNEASVGWEKKVDLLFIDGIHNVPGILCDINNWGKHVKKGNTVLLHDYYWYGDNVQTAIDSADVKLQLIDVPFGFFDGKRLGIARTKKI